MTGGDSTDVTGAHRAFVAAATGAGWIFVATAACVGWTFVATAAAGAGWTFVATAAGAGWTFVATAAGAGWTFVATAAACNGAGIFCWLTSAPVISEVDAVVEDIDVTFVSGACLSELLQLILHVLRWLM